MVNIKIGSVSNFPFNTFFWLQAAIGYDFDLDAVNYNVITRWTPWNTCQPTTWNASVNGNCTSVVAGYPLSPVDNFQVLIQGTNFLSARDLYYNLSKIGFGFLMAALCVVGLSLITFILQFLLYGWDKMMTVLCHCGSLISFVSSLIGASLCTAVVFKARAQFDKVGIYVKVGHDMIVLIWVAPVCLFLLAFVVVYDFLVERKTQRAKEEADRAAREEAAKFDSIDSGNSEVRALPKPLPAASPAGLPVGLPEGFKSLDPKARSVPFPFSFSWDRLSSRDRSSSRDHRSSHRPSLLRLQPPQPVVLVQQQKQDQSPKNLPQNLPQNIPEHSEYPQNIQDYPPLNFHQSTPIAPFQPQPPQTPCGPQIPFSPELPTAPQALKTPPPAPAPDVTPTLTAPIPVLALPQTPPDSTLQSRAESQDQQLSQLKYPKENDIFQTPPSRSRLSTPVSGFIHQSPAMRFSSAELCCVDTTLRMSLGKVSIVDPQFEKYDQFKDVGNDDGSENENDDGNESHHIHNPTIRLSSGSGLDS
ncbi:unnamed protein product [Ambrosiozyma monospora]|uniref:Unnamed protein product n=1 Tax=Ambrosiozyma monospora TaxID=43982 RepID=A0A9W6YWE8_AMBMO|nr:unnamed protein product [Ambrosiozyma monospora]